MKQTNYWAIVPAAGFGTRMGLDKPKQYAPLLDKTVIEITIEKLIKSQIFQGIVVVLSKQDTQFDQLPVSQHPMIRKAVGGENRQDSVLSGLKSIYNDIQSDDWVFVHDAARPCLLLEDIMSLFKHSMTSSQPASIGSPVKDSLKKVEDGLIVANIERADVWRIFTPQIAPYACLLQALQQAIESEQYSQVTDEASALTLAGHDVALLSGHESNIKITTKNDLELAEFYLKRGQ
jgi:2-C-methyl-D-erythritol 4-phosphate cytidylyltransferase